MQRQVRTRTKVLATASLAVALAVAAAVQYSTNGRAAASDRRHDAPAHAAEKPVVKRMNPGCGPSAPMLAGDTDPIEGRKVISGRAGTTLEVPLTAQPAPADRQIIDVQLFLMDPTVVAKTNQDPSAALKPLNQLAKSVLIALPGTALTASVPLPSTLAPGRYKLYMIAHWPEPSLCGIPNEPGPPTSIGSTYGVIASVDVVR